jgi:hypothetical protein
MEGARQMSTPTGDNAGHRYVRSDDPELMETLDVLDTVQGYAYADPEQRGFRLDTPDQVLKSWTLLHDPDVEDRYEPEQLQQMRERVRQAGRQKGVELQEKGRNR